jgi:hypothetical protein
MKPVVIIAVAVVCSVAAVIAVLVGSQQITTMQSQQAFDEYQVEQFKNQLYQEELDAIDYKLNREVCVELYGNSMSMAGESNLYADCLEYGSKSQVEYSILSCNQLDIELLRYECELKHTVNYYNSVMPKLQALSEQHRIDMGYDEMTMNSLSVDWSLKSTLLKKTHDTVQGIIDGEIDLAKVYEPKAIPVEKVSEEYANLTPEQFSQQYDFCLTENNEGLCQKQLNSVVNDYCYQKIMFYFNEVPQNHQILCVSKTTQEIIQNLPLTLENSDKIEQCKYDYRTRDDVNLISICLR